MIMEAIDLVLILALIMSVVLHELAHGYAAEWLGDPTARLSGRLSLNPIVHLDPLMSVILPGLLIVSGSPILFGAAKPVPYNPSNLTNQKWGEAIVAAAGPATNIALAIIFGLLVRFGELLQLSETFITIAIQIIVLNIFLAFLNLVPIPPLDGSKILARLLPFSLAMKYDGLRRTLEQNVGIAFAIVILVFVFILAQPLYLLTMGITRTLIGA